MKATNDLNELAKAIASNVEINGTTYTCNDDSFYENTSLNKDEVEKVDNARSSYMSATAMALNELVTDTEGLEGDVTFQFGMGTGVSGSHVATKVDDKWEVYSAVEHDLAEGDVLLECQKRLSETLSNL